MRCTRFRRRRRPISPCVGTAKPANAARVGRGQRQAATDVHDRMDEFNLGEPVTDRADEELSRDQRSGHRRVVELSREAQRSSRSRHGRPMRRRHMAHGPGRSRSRAGISQVHRVFSVPECMPCAARASDVRAVSAARVTSCTPPGWRCIRWMREDRTKVLKGRARHRLLQHHEVLHGGLSGEHQDYGQRDHSAQRARGRSVFTIRLPNCCGCFVDDIAFRVRFWDQFFRRCQLEPDLEVVMEFQLKTLSPEAVSRAIAKAERYRLLNEPAEAESICLDALANRAGQP